MNRLARMTGKLVEASRSHRAIIIALLGALAVATALLLHAAAVLDIDYKYQDVDLADAHFYEKVTARVEAGEDYYGGADRELYAGGYERSSTFNWRTPLYAHVLGKFPGAMARQAALAGLSLLTTLLVVRLIAVELGMPWGAWAGLVVFAGSAWWLQPEPPWFTETWAGQLILLTIAARSLGWFRLALVAGLSALFLRELALPFVLLCLADAGARRRWGEAMGWSLGLAAFGVYFLLHESRVFAHQFPERFYPASARANWVAWNGLPFLLATTRMNYLLSHIPSWSAALYLPPATFGLVSLGPADRACRFALLGFAGYLVAFLAVGQEFNYYWGWITAPTLAMGFAVSPFFLAKLALNRPGRSISDPAAGSAHRRA